MSPVIRLWAIAFFSLIAASFPPQSEDIIIERVKGVTGASISFKETHICETDAKAYAGYVKMPSDYLRDTQGDVPYNESMFFSCFRARHNAHKAPTTIYLAGGPGQSSLLCATPGGGPCYVLNDSSTTESNSWSWNEHVNMLCVDQPVTSGFSYQEAVESTVDLLLSEVKPLEAYDGAAPPETSTFLYGMLPSQDPARVTNNSVIAARTLWHFSQLWYGHFPKHKTRDERINLAGNSYGGYWLSASAAYFQRQNERIEAGKTKGKCLHVDTAVITNGCLDLFSQAEWFPQMAYNNTYGLQIISEEVYEEALNNYAKPCGCRDQVQQCRQQGDLVDSDEVAINGEANYACATVALECFNNVANAYGTERSVYDTSHFNPDPQPPLYVAGWANRPQVQRELGVAVNFTFQSPIIFNVVLGLTGDVAAHAGLQDLEYLLDNGIKVALIYGDRDYRRPGLGGEQLSLQAKWSGAVSYSEAGHEEIRVNCSYVGGVAKQYGGLSFSRIFQAGHDPAYSQPETTHQLFNRTVFDRDVPTGRTSVAGQRRWRYATRGPLSSWQWREDHVPDSPPSGCYIWHLNRCTAEQYYALNDDSAEIDDFTVVNPAGTNGFVSSDNSSEK